MRGKIGIIVSGGPAPGINGVINSAAIEAANRGYECVGIRDGFSSLARKERDSFVPLSIDAVAGIQNVGGSIIGTSRYNPFRNPETQHAFIGGLKEASIDKLIVIGGDGSAFLSKRLLEIEPSIHLIHVPKTIDNDLILPDQYPSFGFETALDAGARILDTLSVDAKTTKRWFLVTSMGRKAGFLALGLGLVSGACLTLIPEEYSLSASPQRVAEDIYATLQHRLSIGHNYGVIVVAEGLLELFAGNECPELDDCPRDELNRIRYSQIELGEILLPIVRRICDERGCAVRMNIKNIGYELRCHAPNSFDIEYTRFLGYGAVRHLLDGKTGGLVTRNFDTLGFVPFSQISNLDGTIRSRRVDLSSDLYRVARSFMMRGPHRFDI